MQDWTDRQLEEKNALLLQTDALLASGYFEGLRRNATWEPGKKLMLAMLRDAITVFRENAFAKDERKRNLYREAKDWIFSEERDWMFSFEYICDTLGLHPQYVRGGLLRWSARKLAATESELDELFADRPSRPILKAKSTFLNPVAETLHSGPTSEDNRNAN